MERNAENQTTDVDLVKEKSECLSYLPDEVLQYISKNSIVTDIKYPLIKSPENPKSLNIIKSKKYTGKIIGIKGQYLIFDDDTVFNIRSNEGVKVI